MVDKDPKQELDKLTRDIQAHISSIQDDLKRALPPRLRNFPDLNNPQVPLTPSEFNLKSYTLMAQTKLEDLKVAINQLRSKATSDFTKLRRY